MIKCNICNEEFENNLGGQLTNHLLSSHSMTMEDYIIITEYNGVSPKCACGYCDERPRFNRGKFSRYSVGHNTYEWLEKKYIEKYGRPKCNNPECNEDVKFHRGKPNRYCSHKCEPSTWNQDKVKTTVRNKYGVDNVFQLEEIKDAIKNTNKVKYGVEHFTKTAEYKLLFKKTIQEKYGVNNLMELDWVVNKIGETTMKNHGVKHNSFRAEFRKAASDRMCQYNTSPEKNHSIKKYKDTGLYYQSLYEYRFLAYCEANNLLDLIDNSPRFKYLDGDLNEGKWHLPDFKYLNKYIVEIKSTYWMERQGGIEVVNAKRRSVEANGFIYIFLLDEDMAPFLNILCP